MVFPARSEITEKTIPARGTSTILVTVEDSSNNPVPAGGKVILEVVDGPPTEWDSPLAVFEAVSEHEQKVTGLINDLVNLAIKEKDHATNNFLQWFVNEQVEEEASADEVVQQLNMMENAPGGMFMFDRELGQRVFTPPVAEGEK